MKHDEKEARRNPGENSENEECLPLVHPNILLIFIFMEKELSGDLLIINYLLMTPLIVI